MKYITTAVLAAGLAVSAFSVQAQQGEITANVSFTNDYRLRGISQSDRSRAVQGGFEYNRDSGIYAGVWASSIDFADSVMMSYYGGFKSELTDTIDYDVGVRVYEYPGLSALNNIEVYGGLSYAGITGKLTYSDDYFGSSARAVYGELGYGMDLAPNLSLDLHIGMTEANKNLFGSKDRYFDYGVSLGTSVMGLDVSAGWVDTNLNKGNCGSNACGSRMLLSVGKSL